MWPFSPKSNSERNSRAALLSVQAESEFARRLDTGQVLDAVRQGPDQGD